jgi:hypothetical protein
MNALQSRGLGAVHHAYGRSVAGNRNYFKLQIYAGNAFLLVSACCEKVSFPQQVFGRFSRL